MNIYIRMEKERKKFWEDLERLNNGEKKGMHILVFLY